MKVESTLFCCCFVEGEYHLFIQRQKFLHNTDNLLLLQNASITTYFLSYYAQLTFEPLRHIRKIFTEKTSLFSTVKESTFYSIVFKYSGLGYLCGYCCNVR
jgi:hypothetical protein